jgi:hypothetical protein
VRALYLPPKYRTGSVKMRGLQIAAAQTKSPGAADVGASFYFGGRSVALSMFDGHGSRLPGASATASENQINRSSCCLSLACI